MFIVNKMFIVYYQAMFDLKTIVMTKMGLVNKSILSRNKTFTFLRVIYCIA